MATVSLNSPSSYLTGALCLLKLNNKIVGFSNGINYQIRIESRTTNAIDNIHPLEIYPYKINISGQIHNFIVTDLSPTRMKIMPTIDNIMLGKYLKIEVYQKMDDKTLKKMISFPKSFIVDRAESHPASQTSRSTLTFLSTSWEDGDVNTPNKQEEYFLEQSKLNEVWKHLEPFENEQYVPDMAREYVSGTMKAFGASAFNQGVMDRVIDYSVKGVEVASYIGMNWAEDEAIMNSAKNQKK